MSYLINRTARFRSLLLLGAAISALALLAPDTLGQKRGEDPDKPLFQEYRGIQLGMAAEEVRKKLGSPTDKGDEQDFFMLNDAESAQIFYDKTKKVMAISANFLRGAQNVPTPKTLFGEELTAKPDGSVYKMTRYPKAGYWLSYSKTGGDSPLISVTLQKID
ncbi:MAG TPA: hypothetical protein VFR80_14495 [Pyrinomonadaceae bacterium]|nr:hypothetical protein [Pyrinomonadaceae bacterium]